MTRQTSAAGRIVLKTVHLISVCGWLGGGFAVMVLLDLAGSPATGTGVDTLHRAIRSIDEFIIVPSAGITAATGFVLCAASPWGFARYRWIIAKWSLTIMLIAFGTGWLAPGLQRLALQTGVSQAVDYHQLWCRIAAAASLQTLVLLLLVVLSILKPGGTAKTGRCGLLPQLLPEAMRRMAGTVAGWSLLHRRACRP
jgi:uncharacterized membrane protein